MARTASRLPAVLLVVLALVVAACGDGVEDVGLERDPGEETPTTDEPAADGDAEDALDGAGPPDGDDAPGGPGAGDGPAAAPAPGPGGAGAAGGTGGGARQPAAPQPARPGTYTYDVEGEVRAGTFRQAHPPEGTLEVHTPEEGEQRSIARTGDQETEQVLRYGDDGVHLTYQRTSGPQGQVEFRPEQPVLVFPGTPAAGQAWEWTMRSTDGATTVHARMQLLREEAVEVAGTSVPTWVLQLDLTLSGQVDATSTSTAWVSVEHRLTVQEESEMEGRFGAFTFEAEQRRTIRSLTPA